MGSYTRNGPTLLTCLHNAYFISQKTKYILVLSSSKFFTGVQPKGTVTFSHPVTILPVTAAQQNDSLITITACPLHSHGYTHQPDSTSLIHRAIMSSLSQHLGKLALTLWSAMGHCFFPTNISDLVTEYSNHTLWPLQGTDQLSKMMLCMHGYSLVQTQRPVHMVMGLFLGEDRHCHRFGLKFVGLLDAC